MLHPAYPLFLYRPWLRQVLVQSNCPRNSRAILISCTVQNNTSRPGERPRDQSRSRGADAAGAGASEEPRDRRSDKQGGVSIPEQRRGQPASADATRGRRASATRQRRKPADAAAASHDRSRARRRGRRPQTRPRGSRARAQDPGTINSPTRL